MTVTYISGAELGDMEVTWTDNAGAVIDLTGHTFEVKVGRRRRAFFTKTTGITGAATAPNVVIGWEIVGDLNGLSPGEYDVRIAATRTSDGKTRKMKTTLTIDHDLV